MLANTFSSCVRCGVSVLVFPKGPRTCLECRAPDYLSPHVPSDCGDSSEELGMTTPADVVEWTTRPRLPQGQDELVVDTEAATPSDTSTDTYTCKGTMLALQTKRVVVRNFRVDMAYAYTALAQRQGRTEFYLAVVVGDPVEVIQADGGWLEVVNERGLRGWIPETFTAMP